MKVLLDANALMIPVQFGIDIFSEIEALLGAYEPVTLEDVTRELAGIASGKGRDAAAARVGIRLADRCRVEKSPYDDIPVDERIIRYAVENECMVATNDRLLRSALLKRNIDVVYLREKKKLEIIRG